MSEKMNQLKVAVILSGCGVYDGSEAYETVLTLLCLDEMGASVSCFAPNDKQLHVINHLSGDENPNEKKTLFILPSAPKSLVSILFSILYSLEV